MLSLTLPERKGYWVLILTPPPKKKKMIPIAGCVPRRPVTACDGLAAAQERAQQSGHPGYRQHNTVRWCLFTFNKELFVNYTIDR